MTLRMAALPQDGRGTAGIEFALIAPVFIMLIFAVISFGLYFTMEIAVTVAASEGARATVGALSTDNPTTIAQASACNVLNAYAPLLNCAAATISPSASGTSMTVTVSYSLPGTIVAISPVALPTPSFTAIVQYSAY
jgi:Flp pilus assembly protein TadG